MLNTSYGAPLQRSHAAPVQRGFAPVAAPGSRTYPVYTHPHAPEVLEPLKPQGTRAIRLPLSEKIVVVGGLSLLALVIASPVSDSALLLTDFNYQFWNGDVLPIGVIVALVCTLVLYFALTSTQAVEKWTVRNLSTMTTTFATLLGVILVLSSLLLYHKEDVIAGALNQNCEGNMEANELRQSYLALSAIRKTPECAKLWSVEDCKGFADAAPPAHATYLKRLEDNFHCSGFCTAPATPAAAGSAANAGADKAGKAAFSQVDGLTLGFLGKSIQASHADLQSLDRIHRAVDLPPALFSQGKYKTSCDGAASRNLLFMAINISRVWWWMSIVLISTSALLGLLEFVTSQKYS